MKLLRLTTMMVIVLAVCAADSFAQKQPACPLKDAPEFNGFRLGMSLFDVRDMLVDPSMFDSKLTLVSKLGSQALTLTAAELKEEHAEGIESMNLTFVDKRLSVIKATYIGGNWMGSRDFFKQVSEKLSLPEPTAANSAGGRGSEKYKVECTRFSVTLSYSFGVSPGVLIADRDAQKLVDDRLEKNPDGETKDIRITPGRTRRPNPPR